MSKHKIICGKSEEVLKQFDDNTFDSCVTDPPYGLEFMGKDWDTFRAKNEIKNCSGIMKDKNFKALPSFSPSQNVKCPDCGKWKWDYPDRKCVCGGADKHSIESFNFAFQQFTYQWATELYRVMKPGAHILVFGGTRTYHRMACAVEDAGFEVRDMVEWIYGCLSEDTEILTINGWEHYHKNIYKGGIPILIYDIQKSIFKWEEPKRWQEYNINKDTCYRIQSDNTDQLVTRNHRCLVERKGKLIFMGVEELSDMENMPTLPNDFLELQKRQPKILLQKMQRLLQRARMEEVGGNRFNKSQSSRKQKKEGMQRGKKPSMERRSNIFQEERELWEIQNKICSLSSIVYSYGEKGWLCNGIPINNGKELGEMFKKDRSDTPQRSQSREQRIRESDSIQDKQRTQNPRGIRIEKAKITKEKYSGIAFCPTVSTGCFVARRNGKIFITGNSGFPKSHNIGKAIDKMNGKYDNDFKKFGEYVKECRERKGLSRNKVEERLEVNTAIAWWEGRNHYGEFKVQLPNKEHYNKLKELLEMDNRFDFLINWAEAEREVIGKKKKADLKDHVFFGDLEKAKEKGYCIGYGEFDITAPATQEAIQWDGWGTGLKPAHEPILLARKPISERNIASNVLKWGVGGINVDGGRIIINNEKEKMVRNGIYTKPREGFVNSMKIQGYNPNNKGRFPANLILECCCEDDELVEGKAVGNQGHWSKSKVTGFGEFGGGTYEYGGVGKKDDMKCLIHTNPNCVCRMLDDQSGDLGVSKGGNSTNIGGFVTAHSDINKIGKSCGFGDKGGSSRFFYQAKASQKERWFYCTICKEAYPMKEKDKHIHNAPEKIKYQYLEFHPTQKPEKLIEYLVRLITPPNGTVLDPFMGSGTGLIAAEREGFNSVNIDSNREYCQISYKRAKIEIEEEQTKLNKEQSLIETIGF